MSDVELPLRVATAQDWDAVSRLLFTVFHESIESDIAELEKTVYEPDRCLLAVDHDMVVAHAGAFTRELSVPGGVLPAAYVTQVGVLPTHRRQRLLTRMMHRQLREVRTAGREPVAVLWASEGRIYQRFGYGLAVQRLQLDVDTRHVGLPPSVDPAGLRPVEPATAQAEFAALYERLRPHRPGWASRDDRWWRYVLADPPARRRDSTEQRAVVVDGPDGIDGYAWWRVGSRAAPAGTSGGEVQVREVVAASPAAYRRLWRFLLSIDLTAAAGYPFGALDEPLLHLVDEPRNLGGQLRDGLWARLVDVPAALAARRYAAPVDVVLAVTDPLLPENAGHWHLVGDADRSTCTSTTAPAELACDVRDLGAAYLGGTSLAALAAGGRVAELRPGALAPAAAAFGWSRQPTAIEVF